MKIFVIRARSAICFDLAIKPPAGINTFLQIQEINTRKGKIFLHIALPDPILVTDR